MKLWRRRAEIHRVLQPGGSGLICRCEESQIDGNHQAVVMPHPPPPRWNRWKLRRWTGSTMVSWLRPLDRRSQTGSGLSNMVDRFTVSTAAVTEALNAVGEAVHHVRAANIVATSPVRVSRRAGSYSPRLRVQLCLLLLLVGPAPISQYSQSLPGVLVPAVGLAGVDLRSKETRVNSPTLLPPSSNRRVNTGHPEPPGGHRGNCIGVIL